MCLVGMVVRLSTKYQFCFIYVLKYKQKCDKDDLTYIKVYLISSGIQTLVRPKSLKVSDENEINVLLILEEDGHLIVVWACDI